MVDQSVPSSSKRGLMMDLLDHIVKHGGIHNGPVVNFILFNQ